MDEPEHIIPPLLGAGSLHDLLLTWLPPPQLRLQVPYDPHLPQLPSTRRGRVGRGRVGGRVGGRAGAAK